MDIAVMGAGNRARKYLSCLPPGVIVTCLVEPDPLRLSQAGRRWHVPAEGLYTSSEAFFSASHDIQAVIVAAPDRLHVPLSLEAVRRGWHVLLEKPVAGSEVEYRTLLEAAEKAGVQVGVCLEMRYHPYYQRIAEIVASGVLGPIREINHTEHIGPDRMAHTFVRGLWSRKEDAGPIFLSKCCHDADFLLSLTGGSVLEARSEGSLRKFRPEGFPGQGLAPERCLGCSLRGCPYSAVNLYRERQEWVDGFDVPEGSTREAVIEQELLRGRYGRCVYRCDNTVFDTQEVEALLSGGIRIRMRLEGTSRKEGRYIVIRGEDRTLTAEEGGLIRVDGFPDEDFSSLKGLPLHAGADRALVEDFFASIAAGHSPRGHLAAAFEGHRLCYLAG